MDNFETIPIPTNIRDAGKALLRLLRRRNNLTEVDDETFRAGWCALFYIAPGLHPDESGHDEGGWPIGWRCLGTEAFRRAEIGILADHELHPYRSALRALGYEGPEINK